MDFDIDRIARSPFTVGAIGALITAVKFTPGASWPEKAVNVVCGSLVAGYIAPGLTEWLKMTSPAYTSGAAFLFGLVGMSLAAAVLDGIKSTSFGQIIASWLTRRA